MGFRPFVYRTAVAHSLRGYVRNRGDGHVIIEVGGRAGDVDRFVSDLKKKKPPLARYDTFQISLEGSEENLPPFAILESSEERESSGSTIPPDVAICENCLGELGDRSNRRHGYFFITCTDCGPRFSIIQRLPYDRSNTTMRDFSMCADCEGEYRNPRDRRFHAETIACAVCGPKVYLTDHSGSNVETEQPIALAGQMISEGKIVAIKGVGGFHVACSAFNTESVERLRKAKHRRQKPFAVMARDVQSIRAFANVDEAEESLLRSPERPIVLLQKSSGYDLSESVSPGLGNVGVMLPYTATHFLLFEDPREPALVMTSANPPGLPLAKDNNDAVKSLGEVVDYFLMHNRTIVNRCDDSVFRVNGGTPMPIRRSRGFAPLPVRLNKGTGSVLALGAEFMVSACVLSGENAFLTQHIGDLESWENYTFLKESVGHLLNLVNIRPGTIACDLHPTMHTTGLAKRMGKELSAEVVQVQHHHAHAGSIMAEDGLDDIVAIVCDGVGYGTDGTVWGGEVIHASGGKFERLAHLEPQPMPGGDLAALHPLGMAAGILSKVMNVQDLVMSNINSLPGGKRQAEVLLREIERRGSIATTSTGRILDAAAYLLGICTHRTYEGEPAMKLEAIALSGKDVPAMNPEIKDKVLLTTPLITALFDQRGKAKASDLAYSVEEYVARGMAGMAIEHARSQGTKDLGFSGGVAYNAHIMRKIKEEIERSGFKFHANRLVPCGDGGLSLGQAYVASSRVG